MIRFDEFTFSLPRLWIALAVLVVLHLVLVSSALTGVPRLQMLFAMMPSGVAGAIFLFGPLILAVLWLVAVAMSIWLHRLRGSWALLTILLVVPATYLHWVLVLGCVFGRRCL